MMNKILFDANDDNLRALLHSLVGDADYTKTVLDKNMSIQRSIVLESQVKRIIRKIHRLNYLLNPYRIQNEEK